MSVTHTAFTDKQRVYIDIDSVDMADENEFLLRIVNYSISMTSTDENFCNVLSWAPQEKIALKKSNEPFKQIPSVWVNNDS